LAAFVRKEYVVWRLAAYEDKVVSIEMDKYPEYWDKLS
jgi:hypothetical protein